MSRIWNVLAQQRWLFTISVDYPVDICYLRTDCLVAV